MPVLWGFAAAASFLAVLLSSKAFFLSASFCASSLSRAYVAILSLDYWALVRACTCEDVDAVALGAFGFRTPRHRRTRATLVSPARDLRVATSAVRATS